MKQVFVARHPTEAHFVKGLLEANDIAAEVHGESLFGARGEAPVTPDTLPSVWVLDEGDAAQALTLLAEYGRERAAPEQPAWRCASCGEQVESQFTECWRCGAGRPAG